MGWVRLLGVGCQVSKGWTDGRVVLTNPISVFYRFKVRCSKPEVSEFTVVRAQAAAAAYLCCPGKSRQWALHAVPYPAGLRHRHLHMLRFSPCQGPGEASKVVYRFLDAITLIVCLSQGEASFLGRAAA